jgi:hypothetical protein
VTGPAADAGFLADPGAVIAGVVHDAEPSLDRDGVAAAISRVAPSRAQQRRLAAALSEDPGLLTGEGAHGSPRVNALIQALLAAGVPGIVAPACPSCGRTVPLSSRRGETRCCRRCYDQGRLETCSRCGQPRQVTSRTADGDPVCGMCFRRD